MKSILLWSLILLLSQGYAEEGTYMSLDSAFKEPLKVKKLVLAEQQLDSLPKSFTQFKNLESLDVSVNKFKAIPPIIFKLNSLKELKIMGTYGFFDKISAGSVDLLQTIDPQIAQLENLEVLNLNYNSISKIPSEIQQLKKLKTLHLSHCFIDSNALKVIGGIKQLEKLDISGNDVTKVPKEFAGLQKLKVLWFDNSFTEGAPFGNGFDTLPLPITELKNLEVLSMTGQTIRVIPPQIGKLKRLKHLYFDVNTFTSLPKEFTQLESLFEFRMDVLCLGGMTFLCEPNTQFKFPKNMHLLTKLKVLFYGERNVSKEEKQRLLKALPKLEINLH